MGLREEQRELTRRKIVGAVIDLVADGTLDEVSIPAVSKRSGVSIATIYRYFPTRSDLLASASFEPSRQALAAPHATNPDDDPLAAYQRAMWQNFAENIALLRHQIGSDAGREMRSARLDRSRAQLADYLEGLGIDPLSPEGGRLTSMLLLVNGSLALLELHDRQGLDLDDAMDASLWAAQVLVQATQQISHQEEK